jgi:hypothetical protein
MVVAGSEQLLNAVGRAALSVQVLVVESTAAEAATNAAQTRPLVIILGKELYDSDGESYDALARDVGGAVLAVDSKNVDVAELESKLTALMESSDRQDDWDDQDETSESGL